MKVFPALQWYFLRVLPFLLPLWFSIFAGAGILFVALGFGGDLGLASGGDDALFLGGEGSAAFEFIVGLGGFVDFFGHFKHSLELLDLILFFFYNFPQIFNNF